MATCYKTVHTKHSLNVSCSIVEYLNRYLNNLIKNED